VHFRQALQRTRSFTPTHERSELFHVCKRLADSAKPSVEAWSLDFRFGHPLETALVVAALELETFDEHHDSSPDPAPAPDNPATVARVTISDSA
jgi:hypothetical protein